MKTRADRVRAAVERELARGWPGDMTRGDVADAIGVGIEAALGPEEDLRCRGCGKPIDPANIGRMADGCPCNTPRGINHGLVPKDTCTCDKCDPAQTGSVRKASAAIRSVFGAATHEPSEASRSAIRDVKKAAYRRLAGISNGSRGKCEQCGKWEEVPLHMEMGVMLCSECFRRPLDSSGGAIVKLPHIVEPSSLPSDADRAWALSFRKAFATEPDEFAATVLAKTLADVRAEGRAAGLEEAAQLCERERCRNWDAKECAWQIREQLAKKGTP